MMPKFLNLIAVLTFIISTTTAQNLTVTDIEVKPSRYSKIEVYISGATEMTALQFNLSLPSGVVLNNNTPEGGIHSSTVGKGHTMNVQPLESGDYLVVFYNMYQAKFGDGVLLSIPVTAGENSGTTIGSLYNVRMSTVDAVSHKCEYVSFKVTVNSPETGIDEVKGESGEVKTIYDLQGRKVDTSSKGLYIINGKKVLVK